MKMHPDLGGEHWHASLINEAYATLSDPDKRSRYDDTIQMSADELREAGASEQTDADGDSEVEEEIPSGEFCRLPHPALPRIDRAGCALRQLLQPLVPRGAQTARGNVATGRATHAQEPAGDVLSRMAECQGLSGLTLDLSLAGMRFITDLKLPVGKILKIDCDTCIAVGQVRNCRFASADKHPHWQIGVQFITLRFKSSRGGFVSEEV